MITTLKLILPKAGRTWKTPRAIYIHSKNFSGEFSYQKKGPNEIAVYLHCSLKSFYLRLKKGKKIGNWKKDTIKIISRKRKTETQLQQTVALWFSSFILAVIGKSDFQFSKFHNVTELLQLICQDPSLQQLYK